MGKCSWTTYTGAKKTELTEQIRVMTWCRSMEAYEKDYELIYHIPNEGKRKRRTGGNLVRAGLKKGVPDICVPVARLGMHGLYIELKKDKSGEVSKEQIEWIRRLSKQKYLATVCYGADEAIELITAYMQSDSNKLLTVYRHIQEDGKTGRIDFKNVLEIK